MAKNVQYEAFLNETISATCSRIPLRAKCKSLCSQDKQQSENRKARLYDREDERMSSAPAAQIFFTAEWITDTYFQLRVEFLKFGLGGKRCLWQSPV